MAIEEDVLSIVASQAPDYLIQPDASAFVAAGLEQADVEAALATLAGQGHVREDEIVVMVYATEPVLMPELNEDGSPVLDENDEQVFVQATRNGQPLTQPRLDENGEPVLEPLKDDQGADVTITSGWAATAQGIREHAKRAKAASEKP